MSYAIIHTQLMAFTRPLYEYAVMSPERRERFGSRTVKIALSLFLIALVWIGAGFMFSGTIANLVRYSR